VWRKIRQYLVKIKSDANSVRIVLRQWSPPPKDLGYISSKGQVFSVLYIVHIGSRTHTALIYSVVGTLSSATERNGDEADHLFQYRDMIKYIRSYHSILHTSKWCAAELRTKKNSIFYLTFL
jgi:hypothetical protein